jgi:hypothetical protein
MEGREDEAGPSRTSFPEDPKDRILKALDELWNKVDIWE